MSYALELAGDARRALALLSLDVQEAVFDVLDDLAAEANRVASDDVRIQHLFVRADDEATYVRVHYEVDHGRRLVTVERLIAIVI